MRGEREEGAPAWTQAASRPSWGSWEGPGPSGPRLCLLPKPNHRTTGYDCHGHFFHLGGGWGSKLEPDKPPGPAASPGFEPSGYPDREAQSSVAGAEPPTPARPRSPRASLRGSEHTAPGCGQAGDQTAHLAAAPASPLQPLHVIDFIDFDLERFHEAPLGAAQGAVHPAYPAAAGGFSCRGRGVEGQCWDEPPSLRT